ncbi:MAG TPA: hypothetical protein PKJ29_07275 [Giesbergeria sp.]|jgi:hypothetical protein|nr:hypothetical protein [Giesbergeria sp.]
MDGDQSHLGAMKVKPLAGTEVFHRQGVALEHNVADFWRWAYSNLAANNLRGHLAEFLVGSDLGVTDRPRVEWADHDLRTKSGFKVEVKSAAYLQTWKQSRCSTISFGVAPTKSFNDTTGKREQKSERGADVYVFCLLAHKDKSTLDPLNMDQWQFFVLATRRMDAALGAQESLSLSRLMKLGPIQCTYGGISRAIDKAMDTV